MTESFPWVEVFSSFLWILGLAVVLADFSYHEFLVHKRQLNWSDAFRSRGFLWPIKVAIVLILFGLSGSVSSPFWGGVLGAAGFLAAILFIRGDERASRWLRRKARKILK